MDAFELATRCAWCSRVQNGDEWIEATQTQAPLPLWSDGICPSCFEALVTPPQPVHLEGLEPRRGHVVGGASPAEARARSSTKRDEDPITRPPAEG